MSNLKLSTDSYSFQDLEEKYRGFLAPSFQILIEGRNISTENMIISSLKVETSVQSTADSFSFTIANAFDYGTREFNVDWIDQYFTPTKSIEIKLGYVDKLETVMSGVITKVSYQYPKNGYPTINVSGMDLSFVMMRGKKIVDWSGKTFSEIVSAIGQQYALNLDIDQSDKKYDYHAQYFKDNFNFIKSLAQEINYDFAIIGKTLYFKKTLTGTSPMLELEWGKHLHSFSTTYDIADQVSKVVVLATENQKKLVYEGEATEVKKLGTNPKTGVDLMQVFGTNADDYQKEELKSEQDAQERAEAILNEQALKLVKGNGECIGLPEIQAGRYIKIKQMGQQLSQPYHIQSVTHSIGNSGYTTSFSFRGNAI